MERKDRKRERAEAGLAAVPLGTPATPRARGFGECPCPKKCALHGECLLCAAFHGRKGGLPRCSR